MSIARPQLLPIDIEWASSVNEVGQEFFLLCSYADREGLELALHRLLEIAPSFASALERNWLRERLANWVSKHAAHFHCRYHERVSSGPCGGFPLEKALAVWDDQDCDPRTQLQQWTNTFIAEFDRHHPQPLAHRAAAILRMSFSKPPPLAVLA